MAARWARLLPAVSVTMAILPDQYTDFQRGTAIATFQRVLSAADLEDSRPGTCRLSVDDFRALQPLPVT